MMCNRLVGVSSARSSRSAPSSRSKVMRASVREPAGASDGQWCRPAAGEPSTTIYANGSDCGESRNLVRLLYSGFLSRARELGESLNLASFESRCSRRGTPPSTPPQVPTGEMPTISPLRLSTVRVTPRYPMAIGRSHTRRSEIVEVVLATTFTYPPGTPVAAPCSPEASFCSFASGEGGNGSGIASGGTHVPGFFGGFALAVQLSFTSIRLDGGLAPPKVEHAWHTGKTPGRVSARAS